MDGMQEVATADLCKKRIVWKAKKMEGMDLFSGYNYDYLRSPKDKLFC
jgi:hypothetical protein